MERFVYDPETKILNCQDCGDPFDFTEGEQRFFAEKHLSPPKRCKPCRKIARKRREQRHQGQLEQMRQQEQRATLADVIQRHLGGNAT